jgi:HprK-related kinase A
MNAAPDAMRPTIAGLSEAEFVRRIRREGIGLRIGPFDVRMRVDVPGILPALYRLYRDYPLLEGERVYSFHVALTRRTRRLTGRSSLVRLTVDGRQPHEDMPGDQALAVLEWGINLVVALRMHCYVMLHAAAVERNGSVMLLPANPGHGKTTLCTALSHRGWRLFSDECALLRPGRNEVLPVPRPMPLKNESIDVIGSFARDAEFGPTITGTRKGTIAHIKPPAAAVRDASVHAPVSLIVFPRWLTNAPVSLVEQERAWSYMQLASNAFNYELTGTAGFATLRRVVGNARCFGLVYSDLDDAVAALDTLADQRGG